MRVAVLIDGGHLRALARMARIEYNPDFVEKMAHACIDESEVLIRALYYDCAPYSGTVRKPVSGETVTIEGNDGWLKQIAQKNLFAVRRGVLKFRGFKPKRIPDPGVSLADDDFKMDFEQKGVDMRIGLDIANFANQTSVDRIVLVTGDTDCIPAMKYARIAGLQIVLVEFDNHRLSPELLWHTDIKRHVGWPN